MFRFEVYGKTQEGGEWLECKTITPPCQNVYQANLYVSGKYGDLFVIDYDKIYKIFD